LFVIGDGTDDLNRGDIVRVNADASIGNGRVEVTGSVAATLGFSGSLTKLTDGTSYLLAGTNISITSQSNGSITINSTTTAATLQQTYNAGLPLIGLNNSSGSINITGSLTNISSFFPPLLKLQPGVGGPYFYNHSAIDIFGFNVFTPANSASLINIRGNGSTGGGGEITLRSTGDINGKIGWIDGAGELYGTTPIAEIQYHPNVNSLKFKAVGTGKKVIIEDGGAYGGNLLTAQNAAGSGGGTIELLPSKANGYVINSGSLEQSGSASFKNKVEITGSLSVSGSGGSAGTFNQYSGLRYYPTIVTSLPYTASLNDYIIAVSASAGAGVELPTVEYGRTFIIKDVSGSAGSDNINITAAGGQQIDGSPNATIAIDYGSAKFVYFGSGIGWGVV